MPMTVKEYIERGCSKCPYCGHKGIAGEHIEPEGAGQASRQVYCECCEGHWIEILTVTRVLELEAGE